MKIKGGQFLNILYQYMDDVLLLMIRIKIFIIILRSKRSAQDGQMAVIQKRKDMTTLKSLESGRESNWTHPRSSAALDEQWPSSA